MLRGAASVNPDVGGSSCPEGKEDRAAIAPNSRGLDLTNEQIAKVVSIAGKSKGEPTKDNVAEVIKVVGNDNAATLVGYFTALGQPAFLTGILPKVYWKGQLMFINKLTGGHLTELPTIDIGLHNDLENDGMFTKLWKSCLPQVFGRQKIAE